MTSYHNKHETTPTDKNAEAKLLSQEKQLHQGKGLNTEKKHLPHGQKKKK
jgi:hypothetical protein